MIELSLAIEYSVVYLLNRILVIAPEFRIEAIFKGFCFNEQYSCFFYATDGYGYRGTFATVIVD